jgi:archaellum component FlaG (FlaF/FlaG flagellin family)
MLKRALVLFIVAIVVITPVIAFSATKSTKDSTVDLEEVNGYLEGKEAQQSFTVYCNSSKQEIEFTQPEDADFWVKVLGKSDNFLGDFQLSEGEVIELTGAGRFTLVIRSEDGEGAWTAVPTY